MLAIYTHYIVHVLGTLDANIYGGKLIRTSMAVYISRHGDIQIVT